MKEVFDFITLFNTTDAKEFGLKVGQYKDLICSERLTIEEVLKKKQYVQICSLQNENASYKYSDLA
jgi:hypothetical protein